MKKFELAFQNQLNELGVRRKDVCEALSITMPTLKSKLRDPDRFRVSDLRILKKMNFNVNQLLEL